MMRKKTAAVLGVLLGCCLLVFFFSPFTKAGGEQHPNILFILSDDQRWDTLGAAGNKNIKTPNLDRLAREGAYFTTGYVAAPLCCPSRAAFLTGLYPHQTGVLTNGRGVTTIPKGIKTVANYLNAAGYVSGFVGKWHIDGDPMKYGFVDVPVYLPAGGSQHKDPFLVVDGNKKPLPGEVRSNEDKEDEYYSKPAQVLKVEGLITPIFADASIKFLEKHKSGRFFLWLATTAPHTPYYRDPQFPYDEGKLKPPPGWTEKTLKPGADWSGYYSTISHLDFHLGRVLKRLEELGLDKNTVVIFSSDNGFMMLSHDLRGKAVWYEESVRVPWLIKWHGKVKPKTVVKTPVVSVDLLPTVLDIAGAEIPYQYEGMSLLPALGINKGKVRDVVFSEVKQVVKTLKGKLKPIEKKDNKKKKKEGKLKKKGNKMRSAGKHWQMVKTDTAKYVWFEDGTEMLFDLKKDPGEFNNLADDSAYENILQKMRKLHSDWLKVTP